VKFGDVIEGVTMTEQLDEVTGLSRKSIMESKDADLRPRISLKDEHGKTLKIPNAENEARYFLPMGSTIAVAEGDLARTVEAIEKSPFGADLSAALAKKGLKVADFFAAFGQEISMLSDWESGGLSLPTVFAALEVRDKAKARALADLLVSELSDSKKPVESVDDGATLWIWPAELGLFQPTMAMTDKHLMFGLNTATVKAALKQAKTDGGKVVSRADFQTAQKTVVSPSMAVLYVDLKTLFERLYEKLKPMAAYALVNPEVAKYFDPAKLPKAETISRHLLPLMVGWGETEGGMQMDCSGSLSFVQAYVPVIGTAVMAPIFMRKAVVTPPAPAPPLPPQPVPSGNPPVGK